MSLHEGLVLSEIVRQNIQGVQAASWAQQTGSLTCRACGALSPNQSEHGGIGSNRLTRHPTSLSKPSLPPPSSLRCSFSDSYLFPGKDTPSSPRTSSAAMEAMPTGSRQQNHQRRAAQACESCRMLKSRCLPSSCEHICRRQVYRLKLLGPLS